MSSFLPAPEIPINTDVIDEVSETASVGVHVDATNASKVTVELVKLLKLQTQQVRVSLLNIDIDDKMSLLNGLEQTHEELERFVNASNTAGFKGLSLACRHVKANVKYLTDHIKNFKKEHYTRLLAWLDDVNVYLSDFNSLTAGDIFIAGLKDSFWNIPLSHQQLTEIQMHIRADRSSVGEQSEDIRIEIATEADISLALPNEVNQELLELLLQELPIYTQQFSEVIQKLRGGGSQANLESAQRIAHSLKGSANTVGVKGIAVLTHHLEEILLFCSSANKLPETALTNALINAADCLEGMSEALLGLGPAPEDAKAVLQEILDWANRLEHLDTMPIVVEEKEKANLRLSTSQKLIVKTQEATTQPGMVRIAANKIDSLFRLSGESIILNAQAQESMRSIRIQLQAMQMQFELLLQLGGELEQFIDIKGQDSNVFGNKNAEFDALEMDHYNELHTASKRMAEAAIDAREMGVDISKEVDKINEVFEYQQRAAVEVQEVALQTRLMPISSVVQRLQRIHRQTARLTGKQSVLHITGEEILVDGDTLGAVIDPLMHILRNALDHGIETPEERTSVNKSSEGNVYLHFSLEGNNLLIRCDDDGRGLDFSAIRKAAEKRDLIPAGNTLTNDELKRFIMRPNFSTREFTTQTSGRGVGMDAVNSQIRALGGSVSVSTIAGKGVLISLKIPLPMSLTDALLVKLGEQRIAIAHKGIQQLFYAGEAKVISDDNEEFILLDDKQYRLIKLNNLIHFPGKKTVSTFSDAILLVKHQQKISAVMVDSIIDSREVVIKSMGKYIGKMPGFIGATIFGDGSVTSVVDLPELLSLPLDAFRQLETKNIDIYEAENNLPCVLIVDDSLSQRRSLEQLLVDSGYQVKTARDGIEAVELLAHNRPDIVLTDMEMPRMNGVELSSHIRALFKHNRLPIIMITSRTTFKHRQMAEKVGVDFYFTKPVRDEELLVKIQQLIELSTSQISMTDAAL